MAYTSHSSKIFWRSRSWTTETECLRGTNGSRCAKEVIQIYLCVRLPTLTVHRRNKLSHDPNNTNWSKSTTNYGHKILESQGWKPGDYLGAEDAKHAEHYTAANASHIRVLLREDNLGLGAKLGGKNAETFGLSTLSGIFGRLNGKSDAELQKQQNVQRDVELKTYQVQKYGFMNFVSGGLLVGDKIEPPSTQTLSTRPERAREDHLVDVVTSSKKRKARDHESTADDGQSKSKKKRKSGQASTTSVERTEITSHQIGVDVSKGHDDVPAAADASDSTTAADGPAVANAEEAGKDILKPLEKKSDQKEPKNRKGEQETLQSSSDIERARLKQEKRARKEERRKRKEDRRKRKAATSPAASALLTPTTSSKQASEESSDDSSQNRRSTKQASVVAGNRHAVRQRYIQQKRLASMNPQALREILMLKASA